MAQLTNALGSRTAQIRQEIVQTRRDIDHTLDGLERRLAPRALAADVWAKARGSSSAGASRAWAKVREHPLPSAMIGAAVGWLIYEIRTHSRPRNRIRGPIATGLGVLAAGIAAGLTLPATAREDEWMGERRDQLVEATKAAAREALDEG